MAETLFGDILVKLGICTAVQVQEALALQSLTGQRVGEALISLGYVSREQLHGALSEALGLSTSKALERPPLGEVLIGLKYITEAQLNTALERQRKDGRKLGEVLVEMGACSYRQIYEALGLQQKMGAPDGEQAAQGQVAAAKLPSHIKVLVVDDSPLACSVVEDGLGQLGYDVWAFQDPFAALENVSRLKPTIVLTDLDMPGLDGAELCRRLKNGPSRSIPVIILTANDADAQRVSGLRAGADDYVNKSASMAELGARIEGIVRRAGETDRVRKLFAQYTSEEVVDELMKSGDIVLTGEKRDVTVLFADIRNFTSLAETLPAEEVVELLNSVLGRAADAVLTCGGMIDKFLGDGLMAVFGAPVRREDDALRAVQAARMMMEAMEKLNAAEVAAHAAGTRSQPPRGLALGIGINSGLAVAGNVGSQLRTEYTCIGDAVNVAARLCALAGPGEVLVGEKTVQAVGATGTFEALPPVRLKGKAQPVPCFRAVWTTPEGDRQSRANGR